MSKFTYLVVYEKTFISQNGGASSPPFNYRGTATATVQAAGYVPLPQKVVNFYNYFVGNHHDDIIATYYDVVSVTLVPDNDKAPEKETKATP